MVDFGERLKQFNSAKFRALREGQHLVLQQYAAHHLGTRDLAIEMPTGHGKTLVALLISDYALDQGYSVAYLTGTRQLTDHVVSEAEQLHLEAVKFYGRHYGGRSLDDYHQAQAVGIMNYWVYFNTNPVPQPADLLIFDDAHLAEQPLSGIHTLRIPRTDDANELYESLCDLILAHTDIYSSLQAMRDGTAMPGTPPELLSFTDWDAVVPQAEQLIHDSPWSRRKEARYAWGQTRDRLARCGVLIGSSAIEIRPYHPLTLLDRWYKDTKQCLYLSATLGSMDDLQRRVGGRPVTRLSPTKPLPTNATGVRRLVLNPTERLASDPVIIEWAIKQADSAGGRAAWLCSSNAEADTYERELAAAGKLVFRLQAGSEERLEAWRVSPMGHLVTAGRYDGLDFAGGLCRLVIVTTVPQASTEFERFVVAYLCDAAFMRHRVGQRITQALGRANRAPDDRALYLGLDPKFAQALADPVVRSFVSDDVQETVRVALALHEEGLDAAIRECYRFWREEHRYADTTKPVGRRRPGRLTRGLSRVTSADHEVRTVADLWLGAKAAVGSAKAASRALLSAGEIEHAAFWRYIEAHSHYVLDGGKGNTAALTALRKATKDCPRTAWFIRLERIAEKISGEISDIASGTDSIFRVWDDWIREGKIDNPRTLALIRSNLTGTHDQQCVGLKELAAMLGVVAERPPKSEQSATDCRWIWNSPKRGERRVWEVKTGGTVVSRVSVNQLLGQVEVERGRSPNAHVLGCLLTPATGVMDDAAEAAHDNIVLIHDQAVVKLFDLVADRIRRYHSLWGDGRAEMRGAARTNLDRIMPAPGWIEKLLSRSAGEVVRVEEVAALFPSG